MTRLRGLCTTSAGAVTIIIPADECLEYLALGGGIETSFKWRIGLKQWLRGIASVTELFGYWKNDQIPIELAKAWEVEKFLRCPSWRVDHPDREALAKRWIDALDRGGLSERDAVELIIEKDAPNWSTAHEIVDMSEIPTNRTYRNAWRRSSNGGPIWIDEGLAQKIDERRMWDLHEECTA